MYSQAAIDELAAILGPENSESGDGASNAEKLAPGAHSASAAPSNESVNQPTELVVTRCRFENRRVMMAQETSGNTVTVWVLDARRFAPGMRILAVARPGKIGVFDFAGNPETPNEAPRLPRRPGIW
jgi:hypothetical protein